ncbi:glycoside hydrolase family 16 protein [Coralloluteibacterium stylophorae]|uniref:Glycoside hydrolase family 16 protein n=1 Tax=Coralloluteibacterium stylophorae TaxID=1776034 RepID=A0A8J7VT64_9GAMM|nr:glycoside hydrolase family 16 protein [Coralloluteibacterium stylophorae]MBS7456269.1 glycoside hydrolase family 16 protein [Coralloluteibacterium stylophorae]
MGVRALLYAGLCLCLLGGCAAGAADTTEAELDLDGFRMTFDEPFDSLDVSAWGKPRTRWIAHTPWNGDFGDAKFTDPMDKFPFTIENGILRIEARRGDDGVWRSGLLASVDPDGNGFSQKYGYFEARMKVPPGKGVWPAFWLVGVDRTDHTPEIDVLEYYGHEPKRFSSAVHIWPKEHSELKPWHDVHHTRVDEVLADDYHLYGVMIDEQETVFYFDRRPVWRVPTPEQYKVRVFPLVNLALGSGWPIEETPNPSHLYVDYVRAWARE